MARLLRALGLSRGVEKQHKDAWDSGNASDTDVEVGCHALRRSAFGRKKGPSSGDGERPGNKPAPAAQSDSTRRSAAGAKTRKVSPQKEAPCAAVDSDYSLPADWRAQDQPAYALVEACAESTAPPVRPGTAPPCEAAPRPEQAQLYDAPWSCLDGALLQQIVGSLQERNDQTQTLRVCIPQDGLTVSDVDGLSPLSCNSNESHTGVQRYSLLPKGRTILERSEQSAFQPVSKRSSLVLAPPSASPTASTRSSVHTASASASNSAYSSSQSNTQAPKATDSWSSSSEGRQNQHNNNVPLLDCACSACNSLASRQCEPRLLETVDNASGDIDKAGAERVLPRMGISAMKTRGTITASASASTGFQRSSLAQPLSAAPAITSSSSFYGRTRPPAAHEWCNDDVIWHKQSDALATPRRRHSQNAAENALKHASVAEGPYDCPWDERRAQLEALLINNVGLDLAVLRSRGTDNIVSSSNNNNSSSKNKNKNQNQNNNNNNDNHNHNHNTSGSSNEPRKNGDDLSLNAPDWRRTRLDANANATVNVNVNANANATARVCQTVGSSRDVDRRSDEPPNTARQSTNAPAPALAPAPHSRQRSVESGESPLFQQPKSHANSESPQSKHGRRRHKPKSTNRDVTQPLQPVTISAPDKATCAPSISPLALYDDRSHSNAATPADIAEIIDPNLVLEEQGWYYPSMTRSVAETLIQGEKEGSFLVRRCETCPSDFSLSIRNNNAHNGIVHMRVSRLSKGYILGGYSQPYESVPILVHHFMFYALPIRGVSSQVLSHPVVRPAFKSSPSARAGDVTTQSVDAQAIREL